MEKQSIRYGKNDIEFYIERKNVKNINLVVSPDMKVVVSASEKVSNEYLKEFILKKARWINRNLKYFGKNIPIKIEKEYVSGETFKYLGRQYRLKIAEGTENEIKFYKGYINLTVKNREDMKLKKELIEKWYREKAKEKYEEIVKNVMELLTKYEIERPQIRIRTMQTRWGSCIKKTKEILLNYELIKAPKYCIEYVVLHELLHFKYDNHDNDFYNLLTVLMPDWKNRKEILDMEIVKEL